MEAKKSASFEKKNKKKMQARQGKQWRLSSRHTTKLTYKQGRKKHKEKETEDVREKEMEICT